ncbi:farnesol dehydrogenase-like [Manduca sexta]|nr:farnesol dehydrogenase-like [Manduca sexta]
MRVIDVNLKGPVICSRHAVASMKKAGFDGHIININSVAGHYVPFDTMFNLYSPSKHAVTVLTKTLAGELADCNSKIKTTSISPGLVHTNMVPDSMVETKLPILKPSDVADAVMYVISTPPNVNIDELTITPVGGKRL